MLAEHHEKQALAVIGCGTMATAVLRTLLVTTTPDAIPISSLMLTARTGTTLERLESTYSSLSSKTGIPIKYTNDNTAAAREAQVVILACKPYQMQTVLGAKRMRAALAGKLLVSFVAGVSEEGILDALGSGEHVTAAQHAVRHDTRNESHHSETEVGPHIIRVCPNIAAMAGESMTAIAEPSSGSDVLRDQHLPWVEHFFSLVGRTMVLPTVQYNVATVLVGAAIALTTVAVDGLLDGAVAEGIPRAQALEMVGQCLLGTGLMLGAGRKKETEEPEGGEQEEHANDQPAKHEETTLHPAVLRDRVSSPRGCTIQGLLEVERRGVRSAMADAVVKATQHLKGMGKEQD